MKFKLKKSQCDPTYNVYECEVENGALTIIEDKAGDSYGVYARKYTDDNMGYMEISGHTAKTLKDAKKLAEKLYNIVLGYRVPTL